MSKRHQVGGITACIYAANMILKHTWVSLANYDILLLQHNTKSTHTHTHTHTHTTSAQYLPFSSSRHACHQHRAAASVGPPASVNTKTSVPAKTFLQIIKNPSLFYHAIHSL